MVAIWLVVNITLIILGGVYSLLSFNNNTFAVLGIPRSAVLLLLCPITRKLLLFFKNKGKKKLNYLKKTKLAFGFF
jgi:hypothetical protein